MTGLLVGVVGPSGVGKDSVMAALCAARSGIHLARRVITRPSDVGGEVFDGVDGATFDAHVAAGDFAMHWPAHQVRYGVPKTQLAPLDRGEMCLVNLSRAVLPQIAAQVPGFVTLYLSAPIEVLAARLRARGRETADEIALRLNRADLPLPDGAGQVFRISNDGPLDQTVRNILAALDAYQAERV